MPDIPEVDVNKIITNLAEDTVKQIINKFNGETKKIWNNIQNKLSLSFISYLENAYKKYSKVKTLLYKTEPQYLYDFFECNNLQKNEVNKEEIIDANNIKNVLDISKFIIIEGDGGIGKTTMLKHFFMNSIIKSKLIPIFFELKDYEENNLEEELYKTIHNLGYECEKEYFLKALKTGKFVLLFDGYDEIPNSKISSFEKDFDKFCDKYSNNYFIMSSRPSENEFISFTRFTKLKSCLFSKEQSINLIKKIKYDNEVKERFLKELDNNLYDSHNDFASNPLLLTIMLLTYQDYAEIPDKLHIFYEQAFETLFTTHDATKSGYKRELKSKLNKDIFKNIFSKFCFKSYMNEKLEFSKNEINCYFNEIKDQQSEFENDLFLQDLISSLCVMYLDGLSYRFTHRSFQEFFAAKYILNLSDKNQKIVFKKLIETRLSDNVLRMLFDMSKDRFENNAIIPYLEELELNANENLYEFYFKKCYRDIIFAFSDNNNEYIFGSSLNDMFLCDIIRKYKLTKRPTIKEHMDALEKIRTILNVKNEIHYEISIEDLLKDKEIRPYLKKTFYGDDAVRLSKLLKYLKESKENSLKELEELVNT